jgi:RND family efflux transporter MFP subunit
MKFLEDQRIQKLRELLLKRWGQARQQRYFTPAAVFGAFVLVFILLMVTKPQTKPYEPVQRVWAVSAQTVKFEDVKPSFTAFGELAPRREVNLRALVAGEVVSTSAKFEEGALVEAQDELLQIDPFNYQNALADAAAQLRGGAALLKERKVALDLAKVEYERAEKLIAKGTVAQKYVDDRKLELTIAESRYVQQQAAVDRLEVQVARAKRDLEHTTVRAPFAGHLSNVAAREGRLLNLNDQVATISDATAYEVRFNLSDAQYGRFIEAETALIGLPVKVVWHIGGQEIELLAELTQVGARISQSTRGVDLYARILSDIPATLRGGAFVNVVLEAGAVENVVEVSRDALYGDKRLFVIVNGHLQARNVEIIGETDDTILIQSGVAEGEHILLTRFNEAAVDVAVKVVAE